MTVDWRGVPVDARTATQLDEVNRLLASISFWPAQGSYSSTVAASASTHSGGGAVDIKAAGLSDADINTIVDAMRSVGFAAWHRTPAQGLVHHIHGISVGCPDLSGIDNPVTGTAAWQVAEYLAGRNGLAGRGADDGPRNHVGVTWESYQGANDMAVSPDFESNFDTLNKVLRAWCAGLRKDFDALNRDLRADLGEKEREIDALNAKVDQLLAKP